MLEIFSGVLSGVISALGMGGGTILIVILSIFLGMEQHKAQATNIVFFIPTAITAIFVNIKNKNIKWNIAKIVCPIGIVGAVIGSVISINLDTYVLRKFYGVFLAIIAFYEIYSLINMNKKKTTMHNKNIEH